MNAYITRLLFSAPHSSQFLPLCIGLNEYPVSQMKKAGSTPRRAEDASCEPERSGAEESDPSGEESKPTESDCRPDRDRGVRVELQGSELWKRFYEIGTEMIITKAGRYKTWIPTVTCSEYGEGLRWPLGAFNRLFVSFLPNFKLQTYLASRTGGKRSNIWQTVTVSAYHNTSLCMRLIILCVKN